MFESVTTSWVDIAQGGRFQGYLALPPAGTGPGLVLFQEIFGVNTHIQQVARQYALDGFVVLAPDIFWRDMSHAALPYTDEGRARGRMMIGHVTAAELDADVQAAVAALRARPETQGERTGAIGFCLGGRLAFLAATLAGADAAVSYYGGGIQERLDLVGAATGALQLHYAGEDAGIPLATVEKVRDALGARADVHVYPGASHGFNCWMRPVYDPRSSATAHGRALGFLARHLHSTA